MEKVYVCISLLFDDRLQHNMGSIGMPALPNTATLLNTIQAFKDSLHLSDEDIRKIEHDTREQHNSPL